MAILNAQNAAQTPRPPPKPAHKPALFVRTLVAKGAVQRTISCSMLPPHALAGLSGDSSPSLQSPRQLVVATDTTLQLHAVDYRTHSLTPLTSLMLFTRIYDIAAVSSPVPGRDVLVVLADASKISFMQFDDRASRLRCSGYVAVLPPAPFPSEASIRRQARLLATHPRKRMVAVASLQSVISVFPVLFLPKHVNAGKIATVAVDGIILSLDFLEDEEGVPGDAILIALLQKGKEQVIALYTVGVPDVGGGLSVTFVGSMITCASHPDDVAVARATSKLTGESVRPTPPAVGVTRLAGCPFLFAVFVRGRIIAGDARGVIVNAHSGETLPMSVRIEHDIMLPSASTQDRLLDNQPDDDDMDVSRTPDLPPGPSDGGVLTPSSSGVGFDGQEGFITPTQTPTNRALGEPPAVTMPSRRARRGGRDDIPPMPSLSRRTTTSRSPYTGQGDRNIGEDFLSYLFVPAYISLDVGEGNGVATAWVDARDHFSDDSGDGSGLYFVMESGAMFALKWSHTVKDGATVFRIPGGERTRTAPKRSFSVEFIGDVGPAVSVSSLDGRLLYIANDGADGSLRQLHLPDGPHKNILQQRPLPASHIVPSRRRAGRYGLEVQQEFLNFSPMSDFVVLPHSSEESTGSNKFSGERVIRTIQGSSHADANSSLAETSVLLKRQNDDTAESAFDHVLHGGRRESEIAACTGIGRHGSVRLIRPGAPVSVLASSDPVFTACNDMWPIRFTQDSTHDSGIVFTFAQSTAMLFSIPGTSYHQRDVDGGRYPSIIARLVDGTRAVGLLSDRRTHEAGILEDGIIAQIHESGVRMIRLKKAGEISLQGSIVDGKVEGIIYEHVTDWTPPDQALISMGAVGAGFVLISVIRRGCFKPLLYLLKYCRSDPEKGLQVVSSVELGHELSCIEIPTWSADTANTGPSHLGLPHIAILGTYAPSVEVRILGRDMEVLDRKAILPWNVNVSKDHRGEPTKKSSEELREASDVHRGRGYSSPRRSRSSQLARDSPKGDHMTAVPESLCARTIGDKKTIFVGLRDGSVVCLSLRELDALNTGSDATPAVSGSRRILSVICHRKLGYRPVVLKAMTASIGAVVLAQAERPWMCTSSGGARLKWTPLAFTETTAMCSFSVPAAEHCFATVAGDSSLYICGLRRNTNVSVRSFHVGATPRRVLAVSNPTDGLVVATSSEQGANGRASPESMREDSSAAEANRNSSWHSELRVYSRKHHAQLGSVALLPGELVHVLVNWLGFVVVGTSWGIQESSAQRRCNRGRLLLYSLRSSGRGRASASTASGRVKFGLSSEVVLPGAVLAGGAHPRADIFVASCNEEVVVFAVPKSRTALVEIARVSARTLVVSISMHEEIVCVVDRKDSVSFFQLHSNAGRLVRDRSDHRRRIVSDAVLVDRTLALAVDRTGGLFSLGYEDGDTPAKLPILWPDGSVMSPYLRNSPDPEPSQQVPDASGHNPSHSQMAAYGLGQEFDVMQQESGSEQTADSSEQQAQYASATIEDNGGPSGEAHESDQIMTSDDNGPNSSSPGGEGGSDDANVVADEPGGETDEANPAQSADDGMVVVVQEEENVEGGDELESDTTEAQLDARHSGVPRNLVCHHSFGMNDTALRIRLGSFCRREKTVELDEWACEPGSMSTVPEEKMLGRRSEAAICGTLGGALVTAVPMSAEAYELLSKVESELSELADVAGPAVGNSHKKFRSAYGARAACCVDGDLLELLGGLEEAAKRDIVAQVGCEGERAVLRIEGMINDLIDRVG